MEPAITPTAEPTASPAVEPTTDPTAEPTASPAVEPTASLTVEPTASPALEPTASQAAEPAASPTAEPAGDLYIYTDTIISEDLVCGSLFLMGGSLECNGHSIVVQKDYFQNGKHCRLSETSLSVAGDARITDGSLDIDKNSRIHAGGDFTIQNADGISLQNSSLEIKGNFDCSTEN